MERILVTGANGFVGRHLAPLLAAAGYELTLAHRPGHPPSDVGGHRTVTIDGVGPDTDWRAALEHCDVVVHLAGQVPRYGIRADELQVVNAAGTRRLAEQAAAAGAKRFVFLSSVATIVDEHASGEITEQTPPAPSLSPYGASKAKAERHVATFARDGRVGISIRPPLVYGADAKGTWRTLQRLAASGIPLPFGLIDNRRSMIAVENLADAVLAAIRTSATKDVSGAYFVADDGTASVREIFTWLRRSMGMSPRLLHMSPAILRGGSGLIGLRRPVERLLGDLAINSSLFRATFDWTPRLETSEAVQRSGASFRAARH